MSKPEVVDEKFSMKSSKNDNRNRDVVYEVKKDGVSIDWTGNLQEALSVKRGSAESQVFAINTTTGRKTLV